MKAARDPFGRLNGARANGVRLFLHNMQSPINIGMALRVAETYATPVAVFDPAGAFTHADRAKTISDFGCGALQRVGYTPIEDVQVFRAALAQRGQRLIATAVAGDAAWADKFEFLRGDVIAIGNEYDGLPQDLIDGADAVVRIRMADVWTPKPLSHSPIDPGRNKPVANNGAPNLNAAMSAGILCYIAHLALRPSVAEQTPAKRTARRPASKAKRA